MKKLIKLVMAVLTVALLAAARTAAVAQDSRDPVQDTVRRLELGKPVSTGSLTIIPVYLDGASDRTRYATLEDALKNGWITITRSRGGTRSPGQDQQPVQASGLSDGRRDPDRMPSRPDPRR